MTTFTVPATRSLGDTGHTGDHNEITAALAALAAGSVMNAAYAGGADPSGVSDSTAAIAAAAAANGAAVLSQPGTYMVSGLTLTGTRLYGVPGAQLVPAPAISAPMVTLAGTGAGVIGVLFYGGSGTRSANPAADAICAAAGASYWTVEDVRAMNVNGWVVNPASLTAGAKAAIKGLYGSNNAGGVKLVTASGMSAQVNISDVNLQQCEVSEALLLEHVYDVLVSQYNASVLGSAGVPAVHLAGKVTSSMLSQMDCGAFGTPTGGVAVLLVEDAGGSSVTDVRFCDSTYQEGGIGVAVSGGTARCQFTGVGSKSNVADGWKFTGTGTALSAVGCYGNGNNSGAGTAYDVNVTSTAHLRLDGFAYCSSGATNALVVPGTNHVTNDSPTYPGGATVSGSPSGW